MILLCFKPCYPCTCYLAYSLLCNSAIISNPSMQSAGVDTPEIYMRHREMLVKSSIIKEKSPSTQALPNSKKSLVFSMVPLKGLWVRPHDLKLNPMESLHLRTHPPSPLEGSRSAPDPVACLEGIHGAGKQQPWWQLLIEWTIELLQEHLGPKWGFLGIKKTTDISKRSKQRRKIVDCM